MRKEVRMNTSQMLALVGRIESLAADKALCEEENSKLRTQVIGLHESLDDMRREIEALKKDVQYERSVSEKLSSELSNLKGLISAGPVTVKLPNPDENIEIKISLIRFVRQFSITKDGERMGLKEAKDAVELRQNVILPAAIIPDYEKLIAGQQ